MKKNSERNYLTQEEVIDSIMERHVNVLRVAQSVSAEAIPIIEKAQGEVAESILSNDFFNPYLGQIEKIDSFLESFHFKIVTLERNLSSLIQDVIPLIKIREHEFLRQEFPDYNHVDPSPSSGVNINGIHYSDWINSIFVPLRRDVVGAYRFGVTNNQESSVVLRKISGTRNMGFKDSLFTKPKNQMASLIKTLITQTANDERIRFYQANTEKFGSIVWANPFPNSTNTVSSPRVGDSYGLPDLSGSGESIPWPGSVVHFNSRATQIPVYRGEGISKAKLERWFGERDEIYKEGVLGAKKYSLFRRGKLTRSQAFDLKNSMLPLNAL